MVPSPIPQLHGIMFIYGSKINLSKVEVISELWQGMEFDLRFPNASQADFRRNG